jgi:hypothetical protein
MQFENSIPSTAHMTVNQSKDAAIAAIHHFVESLRPGAIELSERSFADASPNDYSSGWKPDDVVIDLTPRNARAAPVRVLVSSTRVALILDRRSHLGALLGLQKHRDGNRRVDRICVGFTSEAGIPLRVLLETLKAIAAGDLTVKAGIIAGNIRATKKTLIVPTGESSVFGPSFNFVFLVPRLLRLFGLGDVRSFRYEPWN